MTLAKGEREASHWPFLHLCLSGYPIRGHTNWPSADGPVLIKTSSAVAAPCLISEGKPNTNGSGINL